MFEAAGEVSPAWTLIVYLQGLSIPSIPSPVLEAAKRCLLDGLGCTLFGAQQEWSRIMADEMAAEGGIGRATVLGTRLTLPLPAAALCNGTAAHGFELDDVLDEPIVHPGAIIIPATLAAAEARNASGERLLLGIIAGYEAMFRIGVAMGNAPAHRGFHKTALVGPIGAAIGAGVVLGLSAPQILMAAGLACSTASGIKSFAAGTGGGMMKRMHAGRAAESGTRMAQLAERGFTAPPSAIDGRFGLLEVFGGPDARAEKMSEKLGENWATDNVFVKVYPCCAWIQAAIQQIVSLRGDQPLRAEAISKVRIGVSRYAVQNNSAVAPSDTMGAQYSFPYCAALALTADPCDPEMYGDKALDEPTRRALARRVEMVVDPQMELAYPKHYGARVEIFLANGTYLESTLLDPHGVATDPCTEAESIAKFLRLSGGVISRADREKLIEIVQHAQNIADIHAFTALLRAP